MQVIQIWGIKFHPFSKKTLVAEVQRLLEQGRRGIHLTGVNPETVVLAQRDDFLRSAINDSDFVNIDNMLVVKTLRMCGFAIPERAATPDVFELFLQEACERQQSVYFLGAEESVLQNMLGNLRRQYPKLKIAGASNGFYSDEEALVREISGLAPTYLFLGLPSPQKERFIMKYKGRLNAGVCYGVGGAFDVKGGKVGRVPEWVGNFGLEGFFRILRKPSNYGKRVLKFYPAFLAQAWRERNSGRLEEQEKPDVKMELEKR